MIKYGRKLIGATDPQKSEPGTIRGDLAVVVGRYWFESLNNNSFWFLQFYYVVFHILILYFAYPWSGFITSDNCLQCSLLFCHDLTVVVCHVETSSMGVMVQRLPRTKSICGSNQRSWLITQATQRSGSMETTDDHFCLFFDWVRSHKKSGGWSIIVRNKNVFFGWGEWLHQFSANHWQIWTLVIISFTSFSLDSSYQMG